MNYKRNKGIATMKGAYQNALHNTAEWKQTSAEIDSLVSKWQAQRAHRASEAEIGAKWIAEWEARFGPRHESRRERERQEQQRLAVLDEYHKSRTVVVLTVNGVKTCIMPIVRKHPDIALRDTMLFQAACYVFQQSMRGEAYQSSAQRMQELAKSARSALAESCIS